MGAITYTITFNDVNSGWAKTLSVQPKIRKKQPRKKKTIIVNREALNVLKYHMTMHDHNQTDLASLTGYSQGQISRVLQMRAGITFNFAVKLSTIYSIPLNHLYRPDEQNTEALNS